MLHFLGLKSFVVNSRQSIVIRAKIDESMKDNLPTLKEIYALDTISAVRNYCKTKNSKKINLDIDQFIKDFEAKYSASRERMAGIIAGLPKPQIKKPN